MAFQVTLVPRETVVAFGFHWNPDEVETPFTTTALFATGAIANMVTSAIAGISSFSPFTRPLLAPRYEGRYGRHDEEVQFPNRHIRKLTWQCHISEIPILSAPQGQ